MGGGGLYLICLAEKLSLICVIRQRIDICDIKRGALHGDVDVVDLGAVGGVEGVDLAAISGVDLVKLLDPADAGKRAVIKEVLVGIGVGNRDRGHVLVDRRDDRGRGRGGAVQHDTGEAVVVGRLGGGAGGGEEGALAAGAELRADPERVVIGEEHLGVGAVGDGDGRGRD